jgi:hypothetical protein
MTVDRSLERAARSWIELGPTQAPDHSVEAALRTIAVTRQERGPWIPRSLALQLATGRVAAAIALLVIVALGGALLVAGGPRTPLATPRPSLGPSPVPTPALLDYSTLPGWIVFEHYGNAPDGSTTTLDFDRRQIWLVKADGSGLHELAPGTPPDGKTSPDISVDGVAVVFGSWGPLRRIWTAPINGGLPVLETIECSGVLGECQEIDPAFSPDLREVAFVRIDGGGASASSVIGLRDLASGATTFLESTRVPIATQHLTQPTWSPDGLHIAYNRNEQTSEDPRPTVTRIAIIDVTDSGLRELPAPAGEAIAGDPDWSPDGSTIVFSSATVHEDVDTPDNSLGIYTIHPDGSSLVRLCGPCLQGGIAPTWTPDGRHVLFWGYRSWALMDPDGTNAVHINQHPLTWFGDALGYGYFALLQPTP